MDWSIELETILCAHSLLHKVFVADGDSKRIEKGSEDDYLDSLLSVDK